MTSQTLFGQPSSPATLASDTTPYTMGMQFSLSASAPLTGIWFYSASGAGSLPNQCGIYAVSGGSQVVWNASATWSGAAGSGWVKCTFPGTTTLAAGTAYKVCVYNADLGGTNWYAATPHYWDSGAGGSGLTSGIITAPNNAGGDGGQGTFNTPTVGYPATSFNAANYWVDVEVTPASGPDYALWDVSPTSLPGGSTSFGGPTSLATLFKVTTSGLYLKGYRYYCLDANQTAVNVRFATWTASTATTGTLLSGSAQTAPSLTVSLTTPNDVFLATPIPLTSGQVYAAVAGDAAFGPITSGYWTGSAAGAAGITNGPLVGFSDTTGSLPDSLGSHQGLFQQVSNDPTAAFPATAFSSSNFWISPIVTTDPNGLSVSFVSTDGNNVSTYNVSDQINNTGSPGAQPMRVLPPVTPNTSYPHGFLIMLPVEPGQGTSFGDSIGTIVSLGAHNAYNLTCIQPGYAAHPWFADNPGDPSTQQETFLLNLVTWIKANLATTGTENIYLIGFSSSGLGGQGLQFRHPSLFTATASWDAPFVMTDYDGTDPNGAVGGGSTLVYGTSANFVNNYELSTGNLAGWAAPFTNRHRIWLGGYSAFQADTTQYDARLTTAGIAHTLGTMASTTHAWHTGWVAEALATIVQTGTTFRLMDGFLGRPGAGPSVTSYSGPFKAGVKWAVTQGGMWFSGYWWWVPAGGDTGAQKFCLWSVISPTLASSVLIPAATVTSGTLTAGAWNYIPLPVPIQLSISGTYIACTGWTAVAGFPDTNNQFNTGGPYVGGIINGPLKAFSDGTAGGTNNGGYSTPQGLFSASLGTDPAASPPNQGSNSANFWIDVQVSNVIPALYAGTYRLWPNQSDGNSSVVADANVNYDVGTKFTLSQTCTVRRIWYYSPAAAVQLATAASIWAVTGGGLTGTQKYSNLSPSWSGAAGSGWISMPVGGLVLPAGNYTVGVYNGAGTPLACFAKDAQTDYWRTGAGTDGIVNGPLSAPNLSSAGLSYNYNNNPAGTPPYSDGTTLNGQSVFGQGPPDTYQYLMAPVTTPTPGSTQNYFVDVEVFAGVLPSSGLLVSVFP